MNVKIERAELECYKVKQSREEEKEKLSFLWVASASSALLHFHRLHNNVNITETRWRNAHTKSLSPIYCDVIFSLFPFFRFFFLLFSFWAQLENESQQ